jgi:AcrR family transcriptional regulator
MEKRLSVEESIVKKALEMFNEKGVEYVGMRELAASLNMRIGNLTYYFPTKDDLVNRLALELADENSRTIVVLERMTMDGFFSMLKQVFNNHHKYRCLMLSFVHLMQRNPLIAKRYSKTQVQRYDIWSKNVDALIEGKYIKADVKEAAFLVSSIAFVARFWLSEAAISFNNLSPDEQARHYIKMIARIFLPYATAKGRQSILVELEG